MNIENDPSCGQILNIYSKLQNDKKNNFTGKCRIVQKDTAETTETWKEDEKGLDINLSSTVLEEQIRQVRNRLNLIEMTKNRKKGKLINTAKKTSNILDVRKFVAEKDKMLEEKKKQEEREVQELKERVSRIQEQRLKIAEEKKEQQRKEKLAIFEKARKEKEEIREKLKQLEKEGPKKREPIKQYQVGNENNSLSRVEKSSLKTSILRRNDVKSGRHLQIYGSSRVVTNPINVYNKKERSNSLTVEDLKNQLNKLVKMEAKKIDELTNVVSKTREAENKFKEITKSKVGMK